MPGKVADALIDRLMPKIEALKVGAASDRTSEMGPVVTKAAQEKILGLIDKGEAEGAKIVVDGRACTPPESVFGDHHMHGQEGVRFYTRLKTITTRWPSGVRTDPVFVMPTLW